MRLSQLILVASTYDTPHRKLRKFLPNFAVIIAKICKIFLMVRFCFQICVIPSFYAYKSVGR